jgi:NADH-quinone oxidoreductase subunit L
MNAIPLLILLLPAAGALVLGAGALRLPRIAPRLIGPGVVWIAFLLVLALLADSLGGGGPRDVTYWTWLRSGSFNLPFDLLADRLSIFMCLVVTGVGGLIVTYATGYMEHEDDGGYARFFCYMDLFIFSMLLLVLAGNFVFLIVGWGMVGLSSYLLIGFWYWRRAAVDAARKAFVMNVIGDVGMILAAFAVFVAFHATTYADVFARVPRADSPALELIALLLLVGGVAKSAQLPLHTWLPDAMEGPTPVSALIHAATMVTAGVYLVGRMHPIYDVATYAHGLVAAIGALTALFAATIALVQTDIKRVLAYSTMSQIGYMFLAVGLGAYGAGFFHLLAHAFLKALLFMGAGNVIHAMDDEQDMRRYGGLLRQMPRTSICFLVGSAALAGIIPFAGFFSKELVLGDDFSDPFGSGLPQILWLVGFVTAILTAFYTARMWWIAFWGAPSKDRPVEHPHEAAPVMLYPVIILAVLSTVAGFLQLNAIGIPVKVVETFLVPSVGAIHWEASPFEILATLLTLVLSVLAVVAAYRVYVTGEWPVLSRRFPWAQRLLERKYYLDEIYGAVFVRGTDRASEEGRRLVEEPLIDGAVNGVGLAAERGAGGLSLVENGYFRTYALFILGGAVILGVFVVLRVFV